MAHHVGIDISLESSSLCVVDVTGKLKWEKPALQRGGTTAAGAAFSKPVPKSFFLELLDLHGVMGSAQTS